MTREERELYALVCQAFDLRGTPYLRDAAEAIVAGTTADTCAATSAS